jgi:hypothetical protein
MIREPLHRRTLLRGAGTVLALPFLEAMLPRSAYSAPPKTDRRPLRMAFLFVPNGVNMAHWTPAGDGGPLSLPATLAPLADLKSSINVLTGLTQHNANALGDGGGDHARSASAWLTGCHPRKTSGANIKVGMSVDQLAAQALGRQTRFPSLEIGCERGGLAGDCDSGYSCAYSNSISWRTESTPVAKEVDPRLVFDRFFSTGDPGEDAAARAERLEENKSILDFVSADAKRLEKRLGAHDRAKLDEYLTGIREIERRIAFLERSGEGSADLSELRGRVPVGIPKDYQEHVRLMGDMMVLAFQADLTRIATFMLANEGSNRAYRGIGINDGHHELSHHGKDARKLDSLQKINQFHVEQLAYVLRKMQGIREGAGTLLDNSLLVYGGGIGDGDRHNHDDLPILVAGKGGGAVKTGRHLRYQNGTPMTNLFVTMLDRAGMPVDKFGDSNGKLQQLF